MSFELDQKLSDSALTVLGASLNPEITGDLPPVDPHLELLGGVIPEHRVYQAEAFHKLLHARAHERRVKLESLYSELGRPEDIIIMMFCQNFVPMFDNWLKSCDRQGINPLDKLIVFCLDHRAAEHVEKLGVKYYFFNPEHNSPAGKSERFGDEWFRCTILYKNAVILEALALGASVLFQDADLVWFKDPLVYLKASREDYDMQIMYDGPNPNGKPVYGNTGFIYLQSNDTTKALFETALYNSASILREGQQQFVFMRILNFFLSNKLIRLHVLPENMFLNGHLFNLKEGLQPAARKWKEEGIVLHYSWTESRDEKLRKLNKFGLNYAGITGKREEDKPVQKTQAVAKQSPPAPLKAEPRFHTVTLYLVDKDSIELACTEESPVLKSVLETYFCRKHKSRQNGVVHLQLMDNARRRDVFLKTAQISRIEIDPPLSELALVKIVYADVSWLTRLSMRLHRLTMRARRKLKNLTGRIKGDNRLS